MKSKIFIAGVLMTTCLVGAPCGAGSLQSYINLGATGCTAGSVTFSNFEIVPGQNGATVLSPTLVNVTPGGTSSNPTLALTLGATAQTGDLLELIFRLRAASNLTNAFIELGGTDFTEDGSITGVLDVCPASLFAGNAPSGCPTSPQTAIAAISAGGSFPTDSLTFPLTSFFDIFVDLTVDGGGLGTAQLGSATIGVTSSSPTAPVPEPGTLLFELSGLLSLGISRKYWLHRSNT